MAEGGAVVGQVLIFPPDELLDIVKEAIIIPVL